MRKFYKQAEAGTAPGGFVIRLDGKVMKTPLLKPLVLSSEKLAQAVAAEWNTQGVDIVPSSMPLTQLANTMTDKAKGDDRLAMNDEIVKYASSDLVCYFATHPADLVALQEKVWMPLVAWMKEDLGVMLETVKGIQYKNQKTEEIEKIKKYVSSLTPEAFTVVQAVMGVSGSAVIGFALNAGKINAQEAYEASCVDEIYQLEKWGEDTLARKKLKSILRDLTAIEEFWRLVTASS